MCRQRWWDGQGEEEEIPVGGGGGADTAPTTGETYIERKRSRYSCEEGEGGGGAVGDPGEGRKTKAQWRLCSSCGDGGEASSDFFAHKLHRNRVEDATLQDHNFVASILRSALLLCRELEEKNIVHIVAAVFVFITLISSISVCTIRLQNYNTVDISSGKAKKQAPTNVYVYCNIYFFNCILILFPPPSPCYRLPGCTGPCTSRPCPCCQRRQRCTFPDRRWSGPAGSWRSKS